MILLIDNYDSFTYNLAVHWNGRSAGLGEMMILSCNEEAKKQIFSPGPGWPVDAGKMEDMICDFAGKKPI